MIISSIIALDIAPQIVGRSLCSYQDRAAQRIAAEQRSLRPLEHLNVRYVVGRNIGADGRQRHVVEIGHDRSEEHTSELQSLMRISYAVFCLKKKKLKNATRQVAS